MASAVKLTVSHDAAIVLSYQALPTSIKYGETMWMGHSIMEITAIYANAVGEEQQAITARMWS